MPLEPIVTPIPDKTSALEFIKYASSAPIIAVDTETTGLHIRDGRDYAMGLSVAYEGGNGYKAMYFPFRHELGVNYDDEVLIAVKNLIEQSIIVFHNSKFDLVSLATLGIDFQGAFFDTLIMAHLINENWPMRKDLDTLCRSYVGKEIGKVMDPWLKAYIDAFGWAKVPSEHMYNYAMEDAHVTLILLKTLLPRYKEEATEEIWEHKQKFVRVINAMEKWGVKVDVEKAKALLAKGTKRVGELKWELKFNANSSKQKKEFFIDQLGLPVLEYTDKGVPSFNKSVMPMYEKMMEERFPGDTRVKKILEYMGWVHSMGLFYRPWIEYLSPDGRLRPEYRLHKDEEGGTTTGRLSCQKPNLQQIPRVTDKDWNKEVKTCLIPEEEYTLIEADYSQLELRLATAYANEKTLKNVFNEGRDIFSEMAYQMGLTRDATKTFVYSTQYGAGNRRISHVFGVSMAAAQTLRDNYYRTYPGFAKFSENCSETAFRIKKIKTWSGRYRHFRNPEEEAHKAMNACIQGGAADIVERIMVKCYEEFVDPEKCRMLLQIHDALVFEVRNDVLMEYAQKIKDTMEDVNSIMDFGVKFNVDVHKLGSKEQIV